MPAGAERERFLASSAAGRAAALAIRTGDTLFAGALLRVETLAEMKRAVRVPVQRAPWIDPGYGLGLMIASRAAGGAVLGHNGSGPGFTASAFHAPGSQGGGVTACALMAVEDERIPEAVALRALELAAP